MSFSRDGSYLNSLLPEQKEVICQLRLMNGATYDEIRGFIEREWAQSVTIPTISYFFRSREGERVLRQEHEKIRKTFLDEPLVEKGTRVLKLREKARELDRLLQRLAPEEEAWIGYSQEFRQYLKMIKEEVEGTKIQLEDRTFSPAEQVARLLNESEGSLQ